MSGIRRVVRHGILMVVLVCRLTCVVGVLLVSLLVTPWYLKLQASYSISMPLPFFALMFPTVCPCFNMDHSSNSDTLLMPSLSMPLVLMPTSLLR